MSASTAIAASTVAAPSRIAVLIQASNNFSRKIILGASAYGRHQGGWDFLYPATSHNDLHLPKGEVPLPKGWSGDGILFRCTSDALWSAVRESKIPSVNVSWRGLCQDSLISVVADPVHCGRMVADYLISKGFQHYGFVGVPHWQGYNSDLRDSITDRLGEQLIEFDFPSKISYQSTLRTRLTEWIRQLPKPVGIMTWSTDQARIIVSICQSIAVSVPNAVSVVTCEYDELSAALAPLSISGVFQNPMGVGFAAAKTLHALMQHNNVNESVQRIMPIDVIERDSSKVVAFYDEFIQTCVRLIEQRIDKGMNASQLASEMDVSKRTLELKFARDLDKTPSAAIDEIKLRKAKQLLSDTDHFLEEIAKRTGFSSTSAFTRFFRRHVGSSPSSYRLSRGLDDA